MTRTPYFARFSMPLLCCVLCAVAGAQTKDVPATGTAPQRLTPAQWREDLQFAVDTFLAQDRSFSPEARQRFGNVIADLQKTLEVKTDEQIIVEIAKAV